MTNPTPSKLAEAKKLLEIWNIEKGDTMGGYVYINPAHVDGIDKLLAAQDLISYEKGRGEQRKEDAEIVRKYDCTEKDCHCLLTQGEICELIFTNPTSDAK